MQPLTIRRVIFCLLCAAITLPIALCVVLGVSRLLDAMADVAAAIVLGRIALALGLIWALNLILLLLALAACVMARDEPLDIE